MGQAHVKIAHNSTGIVASLLLGLGLAAMPAPVSSQVSLSTIVDLAQRKSSAVKMAGADVRKAQASLAETKDVYIPSVMFGSGLPAVPSVGFSGYPPSIANASMQSLVFSFSQRQYIQAARAGYNASLLSLKDAREQVTLDASTAYIGLDTVNQELQAAREQETYSERLLAIQQQRSEAGVDSVSELLQARLTAAQLKLKRLHLETRAGSLAEQLAVLTGLPAKTITTDHSTIPEIPEIKAVESHGVTDGLRSAHLLAVSKQHSARGDQEYIFRPQLSFSAQYSRDTTLLNNAINYFPKLKSDNFSSGFSIQVPLFDIVHRDHARQSAAEALRATVEAEQAEKQNDVQIAELNGSLRELDTLAEIASLKQQIASEQLKTVQTELEVGNGGNSAATPQLTPKAEQLARIDERQKYQDSLDAGFDLAKTRLSLLRALGHMEDWMKELSTKQP
jgi:outer membrane protein TolC